MGVIAIIVVLVAIAGWLLFRGTGWMRLVGVAALVCALAIIALLVVLILAGSVNPT
jgi:hypothetical protein